MKVKKGESLRRTKEKRPLGGRETDRHREKIRKTKGWEKR